MWSLAQTAQISLPVFSVLMVLFLSYRPDSFSAFMSTGHHTGRGVASQIHQLFSVSRTIPGFWRTPRSTL